MVKGFDTSTNNHKDKVAPHDWAQIKAAGYDFVAIRATVGRYSQDAWFARDWDEAGEAGFLRTAYHVTCPDQDDQAQLDNFLAVIDDREADIPWVLDEELTNKQKPSRVNQCYGFHAVHMPRVRGLAPLCYTNPYFGSTYLLESWDLDLWISNPGTGGYYNYASRPNLPVHWTDYRFWQRQWNATIPGIVDPTVDLDESPMTLGELIVWLGLGKTLEQRVADLEVQMEMVRGFLNL